MLLGLDSQFKAASGRHDFLSNKLRVENHLQIYTLIAENSPTLQLRDPLLYSIVLSVNKMQCAPGQATLQQVFHANSSRLLLGWNLLLKNLLTTLK